ncbi:trehalose-phosphatase-domain-containing protein [Gongronella butleri]|nr:trehalose-phosphatase-domain-containing protein [Gongronella butleri]
MSMSSRVNIYVQQSSYGQQLAHCVSSFAQEHAEWRSVVSFTHVSPHWSATTLDKASASLVPVHRQRHYDARLVKDAAVCILLLPPHEQRQWLESYLDYDDECPATVPKVPKYILAVDPSSFAATQLPPTPPLLPVERFQLMSLQGLDQVPATLHSILSRIVAQPKMVQPKPAAPLQMDVLISKYQHAKRRLFLFDYDGTMTPIVSRPEMALPSSALLSHLSTLSQNPANTIWIVSGRDQKFLQQCFGHLQAIGLSAEHGSFMKMPGDTHWIDMLQNVTISWKQQALDLFATYTHNLPGTEIEEKKSSITWHYRNAHDVDLATRQSDLCRQQLVKIPGVDILVGKMNLEVRSLLVNKGHVVNRIRNQVANKDADLIVCAGDDQTDEDMFKALVDTPSAYAILVGPASKSTLASSRVDDSHVIVDMLGQLAAAPTNTHASL